MLYLLGHKVEITTDRQCRRSGADHVKLKHEARADRQRLQFDVDESYVLCTSCGLAVALR